MAVLSTTSVTAALLDIATGVLSDRLGRKYVLCLGSLSVALETFCYATAHGSMQLFAGAVLGGLGGSLFSGNNNALLYESLKENGLEKEFHHYQGRTGSMFQLSLGLSAIAGSLFASGNLRLLFLLGIIPQVIAVVISLLFHEPKREQSAKDSHLVHLKTSFDQVRRNPRLAMLTVAQSISWGSGEAGFQFETTFINLLWPGWGVGIFRFANHLLGFTGYWFAGRAIDRFKNSGIIFATKVYSLVGGMIAVTMANIFSPVLFLLGSLGHGPSMVANEHVMQAESVTNSARP